MSFERPSSAWNSAHALLELREQLEGHGHLPHRLPKANTHGVTLEPRKAVTYRTACGSQELRKAGFGLLLTIVQLNIAAQKRPSIQHEILQLRIFLRSSPQSIAIRPSLEE